MGGWGVVYICVCCCCLTTPPVNYVNYIKSKIKNNKKKAKRSNGRLTLECFISSDQRRRHHRRERDMQRSSKTVCATVGRPRPRCISQPACPCLLPSTTPCPPQPPASCPPQPPALHNPLPPALHNPLLHTTCLPLPPALHNPLLHTAHTHPHLQLAGLLEKST